MCFSLAISLAFAPLLTAGDSLEEGCWKYCIGEALGLAAILISQNNPFTQLESHVLGFLLVFVY